LNSDYIEFMNKYSATIEGCKKTKKRFETIEKKLFLNVFKDLKDIEKSRFIARVYAGLILLSENMNKKNHNKRKTKGGERVT